MRAHLFMCLLISYIGAYSLLQESTDADETNLMMDSEEVLAVREVQLAYDNMRVVDCLDLSLDGSASWEAALKR